MIDDKKFGIPVGLIPIVIVVVGAIIGGFAYFSMSQEPDFQVGDLEIVPSRAVQGGTVGIEVEVMNFGSKGGVYNVPLELNDRVVDNEKVVLGPGGSETVRFTVDKQERGTYKVSVGDLTDSFVVVAPAEFRVSDLEITPEKADTGEPVTISVSVKNVGGVAGAHTVNLLVEGRAENSEKVGLNPGEENRVSFTVKKDKSKSYRVEVGGLSGKFEVSPTAESPSLRVGENWTAKVSGENSYEFNYKLIGRDELDGHACFIADLVIEPPHQGVKGGKLWIDGETLEILKFRTDSSSTTWSYSYPDENKWPLRVGKEYRVTETKRVSGGNVEKDTYTVSVEGIRLIFAPVGNFNAFKLVKRDENGDVAEIEWYSEELGWKVKSVDYEEGEKWELLACSMTDGERKMADFEISDLKVEPGLVEPGEPVEISVNVKNTGEIWGVHEIRLEIDGKLEDAKTIKLEAGEGRTTTFEVVRDEPKPYSVQIGGMAKTFSIPLKSVEVSDPVVRDNEPSVLVTLRGEKGSYNIYLNGPDELQVGEASISSIQMADGVHAAWVSLVEGGENSMKPGLYRVVVTDAQGNEIFVKEVGPFSWPAP